MTVMNLFHIFHTYQLAMLHALAFFGLGVEGIATIDEDDYPGTS